MRMMNSLFPELIGDVVKFEVIQRKKAESEELDWKSKVVYVGTLEGYRESDIQTIVKLQGVDAFILYPYLQRVQLYIKDIE